MLPLLYVCILYYSVHKFSLLIDIEQIVKPSVISADCLSYEVDRFVSFTPIDSF